MKAENAKKGIGRRKEKHLKGSDIILNLKEMSIGGLDSFSSSTFSAPVFFSIECGTKQGYCEDPNFSGKMKVLEVRKAKTRDTHVLRIRFKREKGKDDERWQ